MILWEEYRAVHSGWLRLQQILPIVPEFEHRLSPSMRQTHVAGDKVFVDFSGKKIPIIDAATGVVREAEIFVSVLGASNLTYAEATGTQGLPDWIARACADVPVLGARPRLLVPGQSPRAACTGPRSMIPRSIAATAPWRHTTVSAFCQHGRIIRKTKQKLKLELARIAQFYLLGRLRNLGLIARPNATRRSPRFWCS